MGFAGKLETYERWQSSRKVLTKRKYIPKNVGVFLATEWNARCAYCGSSDGQPKMVTDHFVPLILGGSNSRHNLILACRPCNAAKKAKHPSVFLAQTKRGFVFKPYMRLDTPASPPSNRFVKPTHSDPDPWQRPGSGLQGRIGGDARRDPRNPPRPVLPSYRDRNDSSG